MDPVIVASARKHGVSDTDMLHAYRNPVRAADQRFFDLPLFFVPSTPNKIWIITEWDRSVTTLLLPSEY